MVRERGNRRSARPCAGFTLVEMLAVLLILSILGAYLIVNLSGSEDAAREQFTAAYLTELEFAIGEYETERGDFPLSTFPGEHGAPPNDLNLGGEVLVLALWARGLGGMGLSEDPLLNSDEDRSAKPLATFAVADLFELGDSWDNPVAYFHHRDYGRTDTYLTWDAETSELVESHAVARKSAKTGRWHEPRGVQLISAGADGRFGTDDDITNFE